MLDELINQQENDNTLEETLEDTLEETLEEPLTESSEENTEEISEDQSILEEVLDMEDELAEVEDLDSDAEAENAFKEEDTYAFEENTNEQALQVADEQIGSQLSFDEKVIEKIVKVTINDLEGIELSDGGGGFFNLKANKGLTIRVDENDHVSLDLEIILEYGKSAPEIYELMKRTLRDRIGQTTGLKLKNVNVHVCNVLTREEFAEHK